MHCFMQEWLPPLLSACGLEDSGVQLMHAPDLQVAIQRVQQQQSQGRPLGASSIDTLHIITGEWQHGGIG